MADKKSEGQKINTLETFLADSFSIIFGLFILSALLGRIAIVFGNQSSTGLLSLINFSGLMQWFAYSAYPVIKIISAILSVLFLWGIIYSSRKLTRLNKDLYNKYHSAPATNLKTISVSNQKQKLNFSKEWQKVLQHASSHNVNDWKIAIIDADSILDNVLIAKGYPGDSLGERLKAVERADLKTTDLAWEAHKYRNSIAHGDETEFNQHEIRRIIANFERVFKEFGVI